jgi:alkylation response protein AidB-like acyl-CoA dehydrogenase
VGAVSDALEKAEAAVAKAESNTDVLAVAMAALEVAKAAQLQQQGSQQAPCQHQPKPRRSAGEWLGIACAVCVGGVGIAFASLALAILGGVAAIVVLVLRDMWRDMRKGR